MTVQPGYGNQQLHLREPAARLRETFGPPAKKRNATGLRQYWLYPERHFECIVSRRTGAVLSIFLRPSNPIGAEDLFGLTESQIRSRFSDPDLEGGGFKTEAGFFGRWLSYSEGIGFHFDKKGRVEVVSLYSRKRVRQPAYIRPASNLRNRPMGLAALHR